MVSDRAARALFVLGEADRLLDGWTCPGSTECCRFSVTGREPWLTEVEWRLVEREVARQGRRLPRLRDDGVCPFLSEAGRCTVYEVRPLGCRTYFCDRASAAGSYPRRDVSRLPRALDELSQAPESGDAGPRPLRSWLRGARSFHPR